MIRLLPLVLLVVLAIGRDPGSVLAEGSTRVSLDSAGEPLPASSGSIASSPSMDGRNSVVAFESLSPAAGNDSNNATDIFVRSLETGANEVISARPDGASGNAASTNQSMTADARFVVFQSLASDLIDGDSNALSDIFLRDRETGALTRVSNSADGTVANGSSFAPSIGRDVPVISFCSEASNLAGGDDNGFSDLFVVGLADMQLTRIEPPARGAQCARTAVSADGAYIAASYSFDADTGGASQVYRIDVSDGSAELVTAVGGSPSDGSSGMGGLAINADGSLIAFDSTAQIIVDGDENEVADVFLWSAESGEVSLISQTADGVPGNSDSGTMGMAMSGDGNWIVFSSLADNLLPGDANIAADIFRLDRSANSLTLVSADVGDASANGPSYSPFVSDDGGSVVFTSLAGNIVNRDRNKNPDVFLRSGDFPEIAGTGTVPTALPGDPLLSAPPTGDDGSGIPGWALMALGVLAVIAMIAAASYLLGRKPAA